MKFGDDVAPIIRQKTKNMFTLDDFTEEAIHELLDLADVMEGYRRYGEVPDFAPTRLVRPGKKPVQLELVLLMLERSIRTWGTYFAAAKGLDLLVKPILGIDQTSIPKGEGSAHNAMMIGGVQGANFMGFRSEYEGDPRYYSEVFSNWHKIVGLDAPLQVPVHNLGDGCHGHVTQGLGDLRLLRERFGKLNGFTMGIVGGAGLHLSRTAAEMLRAARICGFKVILYCRADSLPPDNWLRGVQYEHYENWDRISECDVLYWVRPQDERSHDPLSFMRLMEYYQANLSVLGQCKPGVFHMHAQPIKDVGDLLPVFPDVYNDPSFATIQIQADRMVAVRMACLYISWVNRMEPTVIPAPDNVLVAPTVQMSIAEKEKQLAEKAERRGRQFWKPITNGTVIDHLTCEDAVLLHEWLLYKGLISFKEEGVKAPIGPLRADDGLLKSVVVLENVSLDQSIMAALQIPFPDAVFNVIKGQFQKFKFSTSSLTPDGILPCPNPKCASNKCAQGKTGHRSDPDDGRPTCRLCERIFSRRDVHSAMRRTVGPLKVQGLA